MIIILLIFQALFVVGGESFNVTRLASGDRFTNPSCSASNCNSTYEANNGCTNWVGCCYCKCYESYTFRSDLKKCVGGDKVLHAGCKYRFDDGYFEGAKLKTVDLVSSATVTIGQIRILPDTQKNKNLGNNCSIVKEQSTFLYNGVWKTFSQKVLNSDNFDFEIQKGTPVKHYLQWYGDDVSEFVGLLIKLQISCSRAGQSCLVLKVNGTVSWPDSSVPKSPTTPSSIPSTSSSDVPQDVTTSMTIPDGTIPSSDSPADTEGELNVRKGKRGSGEDDSQNSGIGKVGVAAIAGGAAVLVVLLLMFAAYHVSQRRKTQSADQGGPETSCGFTSPTYEDASPKEIPRTHTYEKPLEPIYDDLQDSVGNPLYDCNGLPSSSLKMPPVDNNPAQKLILERQLSDKNSAHSTRPLPKTPAQIAEEVTIEGGYTKLSHNLSQGSPIHADNPVYLTADPFVVDENTGHKYAVFESSTDKPSPTREARLNHGYAALKKVEEEPNPVKPAPVHDYAVLESDTDEESAKRDSSLPGHNYAVLESATDATEAEESSTDPALHEYGVLENELECSSDSSGYQKLVLDQPSPYQSLV